MIERKRQEEKEIERRRTGQTGGAVDSKIEAGIEKKRMS